MRLLDSEWAKDGFALLVVVLVALVAWGFIEAFLYIVGGS